MTTSRGVPLVAVSGPDGAALSSLVRRLATLLRERGVHVVTTHGHGCFLCRRFPVPPRVREGEPGERWARRASDPKCRGSLPRRAHAFLDAAEPAVRIAAARLTATARARGRQAVVLTDRGPLDGLATYGPPPSSATAGAFRRLAGRYALTLLVEAGTDTPLGRGRQALAGSPAASWARYRSWSARLPRVVRVDGERAPSLVAAGALEQILDVVRTPPPGREEDGGGPEPGADARQHVVVSVYHDADGPGDRGGGAVVVGKVARRLAEDFRVTVVTAGRRAGTEYHDGIRYVRLPVGRAGPRAGRLVFLVLLPFAARRIRHDLWLESFTPPFSTGLLPLATRAPVVGIDQNRGADALWRRYRVPFFLAERLGLRRYRHLVAMNAADASAIRRLSPRTDVQVIANGVEPRPLDESRLGRGQFILFVGRIDTWAKGLDLLVDAYDRAGAPLELLLAGSGTPAEERRLAALVAARTKGRAPRIHWVGRADEERKRQLLRDSAFLVMPSRHETFGLVALEGMAYGKPVLHFDLPALRWMRDGGDVAVPPFDVAAFGDRMGELARDAALRRGLGRRSALAARHYTWDEMTGRYLALVHRLLDAPAPARRMTMPLYGSRRRGLDGDGGA
ncbi:glycosyltransferase family 4 protein [Streptomyces sp. SBC-4]|nr:glycosyltransferase family 4 protein [Streptomyces sp. SBC-4]MDV5143792.1 glycosyltransferase family 4 protein [Streptomyces sp. SBC-4]